MSKLVTLVSLLLGLALAAPSVPYSYRTFKAELTRQTQNKKPQTTLSLVALQRLLPTGCGGQTRKLEEATSGTASRRTPPLVVGRYGQIRVTLVDYGGLAGTQRLRNFDIGPRLFDPKLNNRWKTATFAYKPNPRILGFGYRAADKQAEIRLVVGGRFDLRLEQFNSSSLQTLDGCLSRVNQKELLRVSQ